jgi:hypothetical protein
MRGGYKKKEKGVSMDLSPYSRILGTLFLRESQGIVKLAVNLLKVSQIARQERFVRVFL